MFQVDSYSAFYDNGGFSKTELEDLLRKDGIDTVIVTGLALDFCVYYTSKDAKQIGKVMVNECVPFSLLAMQRALGRLINDVCAIQSLFYNIVNYFSPMILN